MAMNLLQRRNKPYTNSFMNKSTLHYSILFHVHYYNTPPHPLFPTHTHEQAKRTNNETPNPLNKIR
jgi:hypothetical protein